MSDDTKETRREKSDEGVAKTVGSSTAHDTPMAKRGSDFRIPSTSRWAGMWKRSALVGGIGSVLAVVGWVVDPTRFAFSYLFSFLVVMTITLGSIFIIIIERLTGAAWSVGARRTAEFFASSAWILAVLFLPIALNLKTLYPWWTGNVEGPEVAAPAEEKISAASLLEKNAFAQQPNQAPPTIHGRPGQPGQPGIGQPGMGGPGMMGRPGQPGMSIPPGMQGPGGRPPMMGAPGQPMTSPGMMGNPRGGMPGPGGMMPTGDPRRHSGHEPGAGADHEARPGAAAAGGAMEREGNGDAIEEKEGKEVLLKKSLFLNHTFFALRIPIYLLVWIFLGARFFKLSTDQDSSKDPELTKRAQGFAPIATILFALSLTFAAFDWIMSLEPTWFSTIFGVQVFAGSTVSMFAMLILVTMSLRDDGLTKNAITVEHFHDMGKLLFGFLVFWAYISFSQFMLIWYAALPEETTYFHHRWDIGPWSSVSLLIVLAGFVIPFFMLISRNVKRRLPALRFGAAWVLLMHVVEMYWLVMPNYNRGMLTMSNVWIDAACLVGVVGIYLAVVYQRMTKFPIIAVGDPRLQRSLAFENA